MRTLNLRGTPTCKFVTQVHTYKDRTNLPQIFNYDAIIDWYFLQQEAHRIVCFELSLTIEIAWKGNKYAACLKRNSL